jgi:hypothetical protein
MVTSFFIYYLIYIFVPVAGPQFYFPAIGMDNVIAQNFLSIGDYFNNNAILLPGPGFEQGFFFDCGSCDHGGVRFFLSRKDELTLKRKGLVKAIERLERQIKEIDNELETL